MFEIPTQDGLPPCVPLCAGLRPVDVYLEPGRYSWCSCGHSQNQPFCDGAHKDPACGTNRRSVKFELEQAQVVRLCLCKHTQTPPFCDGSCESLVIQE